ncbi:MAG: hypothetical protein QM831_23460 [Kofleriaceae bacterium]
MQLTPEQIEKFRSIGLRLDREGTFWQEGASVTHQRLRQALLRWLDVRDDGRDIIKLDDTRYAYVDVEDAHLRAKSARWDGDRCFITWDDDQEKELEYGTLTQAPDNALYVRINRLKGRIASPAYQTIAERIVEGASGWELQAAGKLWPIPSST